jgi:hypothetical protein
MTELHENESRRSGDNDKWRLEKSVSLPNIAMTLAQVGILVWFMATWSAHTDENTRRLTAQEDFQKTAIQGPNGLMERTTRMEEQEKTVQKSLDRIEVILATPPAEGRKH